MDSKMTQVANPVYIRQALTKYYNEAELRTLCFDLAIDYESLGGRDKAENATEIVTYAQRHGRLSEIVDYIRNTRPRVQLPMIERPEDTPPSILNTDSMTEIIYSDNQQPVMKDVVLHPKTIEDFKIQLAELNKWLYTALQTREFDDPYDGETAIEDLKDIQKEINSLEPRSRRIFLRLENITDILELTQNQAQKAGKTPPAVIKAFQIVHELVKAVPQLFTD